MKYQPEKSKLEEYYSRCHSPERVIWFNPSFILEFLYQIMTVAIVFHLPVFTMWLLLLHFPFYYCLDFGNFVITLHETMF